MLHALIMAGGSGTRFWPQSRQRLPKQFLTFFGGQRSLLQQTFDRIHAMIPAESMWVFTNALHVEKTREQLPEIPPTHIVGEPAGRDTAACIGTAAALLARHHPHTTMVVFAADHLIQPIESFQKAIQAAAEFLDKTPEALVTFGIPPSHPATGYGYLRRGELADDTAGTNIYRLHSFQEKPARPQAEEYLASGQYYWNSGIFCWKVDTILSEMEQHTPELYQAIGRIADSWDAPDARAIFQQEFSALPKISIDYAVMEKAQTVYMVEAPFQWDDVGSWLALERVLEKDEQHNVVVGFHQGLDSENCVIVGPQQHLITTMGVKDLIIVHTPDATLVANRQDEQSVKQLLEQLRSQGLEEYL